ncbi:hypothetical protein NDU88_005679 [Pleurodeles waltl]|uniref:Uncharacterized protein n=1 Tax=Pleurodeles waltl TaxID=8319 RepID=A0AAV7VJN6_PLEWA|nr:hypothetical protein NDU88_005679 [Pleurodeles waltl]
MNGKRQSYLLGHFSQSKNRKVTSRFAGLVLLLAKRLLTRRWKAATASSVAQWRAEVGEWGLAEGTALHWEEYRVMKQRPITLESDTLLESFKAATDNGTENG